GRARGPRSRAGIRAAAAHRMDRPVREGADVGRADAPAGDRLAPRARPPGDPRMCSPHNDSPLDNLVLDPDDPERVVGVLDWELATIGDPLMDLGGSLAYWVQADDGRLAHLGRRQPAPP